MPLSCGFAHISFRFVPFYLCGLANFNTVCYPVDLYTSSCDCPVDLYTSSCDCPVDLYTSSCDCPVDLYTSSCDCPVDDIRVRTSVNVLESREIKMRMTAAE